MREFKFRAIHKDSNTMVYGNLIKGTHEGKSFTQIEKTDSGSFYQWEVLPETVGQYTGITDSGKSELYEGDIIENDGVGYKIYWSDYSGGWDCVDTEGNNIALSELASSDCTWYQGNIHENPEMLRPLT